MISNRRYEKSRISPGTSGAKFYVRYQTYVKRSKHVRSRQSIRWRPACFAQLQLSFKVCARKRNPHRPGRRTRRGVTLRWSGSTTFPVRASMSLFTKRLLAAIARLLNPLMCRAVAILTFVSTQKNKNQLTVTWSLTELSLRITPFLQIVEI